MICQYKIDKLTKNELFVLGYILQDLLIDKKSIGDARLPLNRIKWLRLNPLIERIKQSEELVVDEYKPLIKSIICKLIS